MRRGGSITSRTCCASCRSSDSRRSRPRSAAPASSARSLGRFDWPRRLLADQRARERDLEIELDRAELLAPFAEEIFELAIDPVLEEARGVVPCRRRAGDPRARRGRRLCGGGEAPPIARRLERDRAASRESERRQIDLRLVPERADVRHRPARHGFLLRLVARRALEIEEVG